MAKLPVEKMRELERRFGEIEARMSAGPAADVYVKLASEYSELEPVVKKIRAYEAATGEAADLRAMLADKATDREMRDLADMELPEVESRIETLEGEIQILLLPKDAADEKARSSKSAPARADRKLPSSPAIFSACMSALPRQRAGRSTSSPPAKEKRVVSRKSSRQSAGGASSPG